MAKTKPNELAKAIIDTLRSPNVADSNGEPANLVDVAQFIANAIHEVAEALKDLAKAIRERPS